MTELVFNAVIKGVILPPGLFVWMALFAFVMLLRGHDRITALLLLVIVGAGYTLSSPFGATLVSRPLESPYPPYDIDTVGAARAVVVLAGGVKSQAPEYGQDTLNLMTLIRLRYGVRVHKETQLPLMLVGGGTGEGAMPEAELMAQAARKEFGVKVAWTEGNSVNTAGNAMNAAEILRANDIDTVVLVTSAFHMTRARRAFAHHGIRAIPAGTDYAYRSFYREWKPRDLSDFVPGAYHLMVSRNALHEYLGIAWYRLRYGIGAVDS